MGITEKNVTIERDDEGTAPFKAFKARPRVRRSARFPRCPLRVRSVSGVVAASSAMICIEERGGKPEQAGPVEPRRRIDPVPAGSFALRFRLGTPLARIDRVRGVSRRLDVAVAQVAAAYADLERNNRI